MAIDYQSAFNSGELSGRMNGRNSLEVYKNGCSRLENFYVLPQGGVERRTGTEFIAQTNDGAGDGRAKLIPFVFSSTQSYAVEIGDGYITVWDDETPILVTDSSPYSDADLDDLEFVQRFDILYIQSPNHPIYQLNRVTLDPTFTLTEIEYDYPPLLDQNDTDILLTPSASTGEITIDSSEDFFNVGHIGAFFQFEYPYAESAIIASGDVTGSGTNNSDEIDVSGLEWVANVEIGAFISNTKIQRNINGGGWNDVVSWGQESSTRTETYIQQTAEAANTLIRIQMASGINNRVTYSIGSGVNRKVDTVGGAVSANHVSDELKVGGSKWSFSTSNTWNGSIDIERLVNGIWEQYVHIADTTVLDSQNFTYESPGQEELGTKIRVSFVHSSGSLDYSLIATGSAFTGLVEVTGYNSTTQVDAVVINELGGTGSTKTWSEGAFSDYRGWPRAITFHEDRMWLAGSDTEPSTIHASVSGDYYNFAPNDTADGAIRRIPDNPELAQWLVGRKRMILGTEGGAIVVKAVDERELIDASNIVTASQAVFGASAIPAIEANDVIIYAERSNKKLRELVYNDTEENYRSADMNILNNEILSGGVKELFLQQQPDQIVWAIDGNGDAACLTYERVQEVVGWSRFITDGEIQSACRLPSGASEDEVWMCVKRNGKYLIERTKSRSDASWFVDSGVKAITGLDHLEGLTVRCVVDGEDDGTYTVSGGAITPATSGTDYLVGLDYDSILRTMPIEPGLVNRLPNSRVKGSVKAIAEFYPTRGGFIGEKGKDLEGITLGDGTTPAQVSGEKKFPIKSDWTREKIIEIKQSLPYPMVVLSLAVWTEVRGG